MQSTLTFLDAPASAMPSSIDPAVRAWFIATFGQPTTIQRLAWPSIVAGRNLLLSAPTGQGKTLAAFLPWLKGSARVLYLSPLKALTSDIARNLRRHLDGVGSGKTLAIWHGDTSADERRATLRHPPEILLSTPESLAVLLSRSECHHLFSGLRCVIVDELHALAGNKRGADLAISLERLARLADGPLARVGISATASPLDETARFLVGVGRPCDIATVDPVRPLEIRIQPVGRDLVRWIAPEIDANRSVLVFTQSRRLAERLSWVLRSQRLEWTDRIAVHHSCLAAERRREVETQLKAGNLRAVVCSTSLEMGVDIGSVDLVVLVQPPGDVVRLLQRLGRSGHGPARARRGLILVDGAGQLLEAAVTAASGRAGQCEPIPFAMAPLDVLAQQILGCACAGTWSADDLYEMVRGATPFRDLSRADFDDCVAYLRGLDRAGNAWLLARLRGPLDALVVRDAKTARLLRRNLGTILSEPGVAVEIEMAPREGADEFEPRRQTIGEIDPSFSERLEPGDRFLLDGRSLEVRAKETEAVLVRDSTQRPVLPRWAGSGWPMSTELARRLFALRIQAAEAMRDGPQRLAELLRTDYDLDADALKMLADHFERQEAVSEIPEADGALVEIVTGDRVTSYHVHTALNRAGNDALSRVVTHRLARDHHRSATTIVADLGLLLQPRGGALVDPANLWRTLLDATDFEADLAASLEASHALRDRFERVARTGLMILRNTSERQRSRVGGTSWTRRRLFEQVRDADADFVLLRQARRELHTELCDGAAALAWAMRLRTSTIRCRWLTQTSPFAESWTQEDLGGVEIVETSEATLHRLHAVLMGGTTP